MIGIGIGVKQQKVGGYGLAAPIATAATGIGQTSFTANWNAYPGAVVYLLDVSTSPTFDTLIGINIYENQQVNAPTTSYVVIGLEPNTTYYYRVRASTEALTDPDAAAFFARVTDAGGSLSTTEQDAILTLVANLKADGIWTKMKAIYPMVGASAAACAQNLKSSSFTGTFTATGWDFASTGATPDGFSAYMNTGLIPNVDLLQNSSHLSVYIRGTNTNNQIYIGGKGSSNTILNYILNFGFIAVNNGDTATTVDRAVGMYINSRTSSTNLLRIKNGVVGNTLTITSTGLHERPLWLGAYNNNNSILFPSNNENAFASIGDGLTDTEASNFYTAVQGFNTTLGRYVGAPWYDNGELLLDAYPSSAAAYSLRKLRNNYVGGPIRVRRSSDNAEQDIYFDANGELDTAQLTTFCGAGDGFVKTWYDQSGNARNATQGTAANQPQIVSGGSVILDNGKPSLQFDGSNDTLISSVGFMNNAANVYSSVVFSTTSTTTNQIVHSNPNQELGSRGYDVRLPNSTQIQLAIRTNPSNISTNAVGNFNYSSGNYNLVTSTFNASLSTNEQKIYGNASLVAETSNSGDSIQNGGGSGGMLIGYFSTPNSFGAFLNGNVGELIFYTSDQSSNRTGIETNINDFYSIY